MPVERPTFHESWYRVADLHPKLRSTVQVTRQHFRGQPWHVVQDHSNNAFFRLAEPAYRFIALLDGKRTVGEAWTLANEQLGDDAPTQGEAIQLLGQLYTSNLLQAEVPADTHTLFARFKKRKQREITGYLMNIMFARVPIFDPDNFLNKWLPLLGWIFAPLGLVVWVGLIVAGVWSIGQVPNWSDQILDQKNKLLAPENLILLYVAFALIKACHEMGHAISCKKFGRQAGTGGEVHVIGIMFLVFTPVPYVDASSSWALTNKWHRAIVGAAGMWVELAIASVAAIVWANSNDNSAWHAFAYNIMFVAGFSTIVFNANPLLRYDGYYILSDLLEIPNLAQRGKEYVYYLVKKYAWGVKQARNPAYGRAEKFWLFVYAIASFVMRIFVTFSIMFYLTSVLNGTLIILAAGMTIAGLITWAVVPTGKFIHYLFTNGELSRVRARAIWTSVLSVGLLVVVFGVIKFPDHARAEGVVAPDTGYLVEIWPPEDGRVVTMNAEPHVGDGTDAMAQRLKVPYIVKGETLLALKNEELEKHEMAQLETTLESLKVRHRDALAHVMEDPMASAMASGYAEQIANTESQIEKKQKEIEQLVYKAPISGVLVSPDMEQRQYAYIKRGDRLGVIVDLDHLVIEAATSNDLGPALMAEGLKRAEVRVEGRPDILLTGSISFPPAGATNLPSAALGYQVGGQTTTATDDRTGTKAAENIFLVQVSELKLQNAPGDVTKYYPMPLLPGQRVIVRFEMPAKSLLAQGWNKLRQVFQKKFQL